MTDNDRVVLTVPARNEFARTVRLTAAEIATRTGMTIDDVDDVKLAVEEAFVFSTVHLDGGELTFSFGLEPSAVELLVGPLPAGCAGEEEADAGERYARFILQSICDEFEVLEREDGCFLRLLKKAV